MIDGQHRLITDQPERLVGEGSGPSPHELFLAALAACVTVTLVQYARTKGWVGDVHVAVDYDHHHSAQVQRDRRAQGRPERGTALRAPGPRRARARCDVRSRPGSSSKRRSRASRKRAGQCARRSRRWIVSKRQIVILGAGEGGTMTANRLRRRFDPDEAEIHIVDRDDRHVYQPGLLFVPFGLAHVDEIVRPPAPAAQRCRLPRERGRRGSDRARRGSTTGIGTTTCSWSPRVRPQPEETEGPTMPAGTSVSSRSMTLKAPMRCNVHSRASTAAAWSNLVDMPIKCPVAPLEFAFLADWYLRERGIRNRTELVQRDDLPRRSLHEADRLRAPRRPAGGRRRRSSS